MSETTAMKKERNNSRQKRRASEEKFWQAVQSRDAGCDGAFVFAVRSTGIYCRPSCPARRPRREQVVFFHLPEAAEQAGFRACRRCHPRQAEAGGPQTELVQRACRQIKTHLEDTLEEPLTLTTLSKQVGISPYHLQRVFKRIMGITPRQYADACRLGQFKARLKGGESVSSAMYNAGYGSSSRLYERAPAQLGMTPATYRRGGRGMHINFTIVDCPLGRLLVAATEKGVCAVSLGDSDVALKSALASEYPAAEIHPDGEFLKKWVDILLNHLRGQRPRLELPLDVQATAFQWRVWEALRSIPYGSTRSYSEIARAIGQPKAVRAVARACATNPVALVIPCHRAVREDKTLGGYRWGLERKHILLKQERVKGNSR